MTITLLIFFSFLLTVLGVWLFRRATRDYSRLLDIPNERSSHTVPVTRGAGIAIALVVLILYLSVFGGESNFAFVLGAVIVAAVSFLDDLFSLPIALRLTIHIAAAIVFVFFSSDFNFNNTSAILPAMGYVVLIVWTTNAYNFMDGIDGLAAVQGVATSFAWILLGVTTGNNSTALTGSILLGACSGFIVFNWQPAKVFMGDVGSTFLGFTFAVIPLLDASLRPTIAASHFILVAVFLWLFMFDTVYTRLGQILLLKPFWKAHKDHLYQRIVNIGYSHGSVAAFFGLFGFVLAGAFVLRDRLGSAPFAALMLLGPTCMLVWAKKKRLT